MSFEPGLFWRALTENATDVATSGTSSTTGNTAEELDPKVFWPVNGFIFCLVILACVACYCQGGGNGLGWWRTMGSAGARMNSDEQYRQRVLRRQAAEQERRRGTPEKRRKQLLRSFKRCKVHMVVRATDLVEKGVEPPPMATAYFPTEADEMQHIAQTESESTHGEDNKADDGNGPYDDHRDDTSLGSHHENDEECGVVDVPMMGDAEAEDAQAQHAADHDNVEANVSVEGHDAEQSVPEDHDALPEADDTLANNECDVEEDDHAETDNNNNTNGTDCDNTNGTDCDPVAADVQSPVADVFVDSGVDNEEPLVADDVIADAPLEAPMDEETGQVNNNNDHTVDNNNNQPFLLDDYSEEGADGYLILRGASDSNGLVSAGHGRQVPNCCAICLAPYEVGEHVIWSSNDKCPHAFHMECIVDWLTKMRDGTPCPCCRAEFTDLEKHRRERRVTWRAGHAFNPSVLSLR